MATIVFFHAHPDDEALFTGGSMARAAGEGHRVVLVTATRGEQGVDRAGVVPFDGTVGRRREAELGVAAARLNVSRFQILGYEDSGIDGGSATGFCRAPVEEAALRLAAVLGDESADVLVTYDEQGIYGHPDHLQVHQVGVRAAELAGVGAVFLATVDRARLQELLQQASAFGLALGDETLDWARTAGVAAERITVTVDVSDFLDAKRSALAAHQTQFPPGTALLELAPPAFRAVFGTEWYIEPGGSQGRSWFWD